MQRGPLGPVGRELAQAGDEAPVSLRLLGEMGALFLRFGKFPPASETPDWDALTREQQDEYGGDLDWMMSLEEFIRPTHDWARILSTQGFTQFEQAITNYHDALPFAPTERRWLESRFEAFMYLRKPSNPDDPESPIFSDTPAEIAVFRTESATLMVGGRPQHVTGDELIQRWWSWQRGVDEFEGSQGYTQAIKALRELVTLVVIEPPPGYVS